MKKLLAVLLAGVLSVGMATTAFAAPSPSADQNTAATQGLIANVQADDITDDDPVVIIYDYTEAGQTGVDEIKADLAGVAESCGISADVAANLEIADLFELTLESGNDYEGTATITFNVPGMAEDSTAYVLHYDENAGAWEDVTSAKRADEIDGTFKTGFSPVAIVVDKATLKAATAGAANAATTGTASPKTGEFPMTATLIAIAGVAFVGMMVSRKKFA